MKGIISNPVVFFTLGNCNDFAASLTDAIGTYVNGAEFIKVSANFDDEFIRTEASRCWREFLTNGVGKSDIIRANFFVYADETALALPKLIVSAEKYFSALYPAGVLVDIYCLLDDANLLSHTFCRKNVLQMLQKLCGEHQRIYLLSNLSSINTFEHLSKSAQTAALLTLFKDCSPGLYIAEADASRYSEFFFLENCAARNGDFLTAGSLVLSVPQDALKALIMAEILTYCPNEPNEPEPVPEPVFPQKRPTKSMDYLYGLAIPEFNLSNPLSRGAWITRLFGQRLAQIADDYEEIASDDDKFSPGITNLYELSRQVEGFYKKAISDAIEKSQNDLCDAEEKLNAWLEKKPDFSKGSPESATRRLSPLQNQNLFPYVLASEFLKKQINLQFIKEKINVLKHRLRLIERYLKKIKKYISEVDAIVLAQENQIHRLNETFRAFTENKNQNAADYFRKKFKKYAKTNSGEIEKLSIEMTEALFNNEFSGFTKRLSNFIEINILPAPQFTEPINVLLRELTGSEDISAALSEWLLQHVHFGIRLKTGYAKLYTEANLFMPEANAAYEVKKQYEARGLGRMNVFAPEIEALQSGSAVNRLAVLYHSGAFSLDELYYDVSKNA
ncbi:MAG: hypothetical protein FWE27_00965 [Defluviitaleaceae bacterium]|nr:hypothetical protein [Defluviitaleaceae bacterium]